MAPRLSWTAWWPTCARCPDFPQAQRCGANVRLQVCHATTTVFSNVCRALKLPLAGVPRVRPSDCNVSVTVGSAVDGDRFATLQSGHDSVRRARRLFPLFGPCLVPGAFDLSNPRGLSARPDRSAFGGSRFRLLRVGTDACACVCAGLSAPACASRFGPGGVIHRSARKPVPHLAAAAVDWRRTPARRSHGPRLCSCDHLRCKAPKSEACTCKTRPTC